MKPFVVVVGASLLGCAPAKLPNVNPPEPTLPTPPEPAATLPEPVTTLPEPLPTRNPPRPLPDWDSVASGHPPGATNPPYPVLVVVKDSGRCFKAWRGGMMPPSADERNAGGMVTATLPEALEILGGGTEVACPEGQPSKLLAAWATKDAPPK